MLLNEPLIPFRLLDKKICWTNTTNYDESDFVVVGLADESHSHSTRRGTSKAPDEIRKISWENDVYVEKGIPSVAYPNSGITGVKIFDHGNIKREQISSVYEKIISDEKIPISIGGDHSLTTPIIKTIAKKFKPISLVYFDAHPDFLSSTTDFYGSVIYDILPYIDIKKSVQIGIRSPEKEEIENIGKYGLKIISPDDILNNGLKEIKNIILDTIGENVYVSFDMDALDPAFAPGVSVPVPMGISGSEALNMMRPILSKGIIGFDLMEVCPAFDHDSRTCHLSSRLIGETLGTCKVTKSIKIK